MKFLDRIDGFFTPRRILMMTFIFGAIFGLIFLFFNDEMYRDVGNCYAWYAREFSRGFWNSREIAYLPPLNIFLTGLLAKCGVEPFRGLILIAVLFYLLTVFPLYKYLKLFLSDKKAAWGCFLFVTTPKIIRFAGMGILESGRDFFLVSSMYLLFLHARGCASRKHSALLGAALGLLVLSRGEGMVMAGLIVVGLVLFLVRECRSIPNFFQKFLVPVVLTGVTALLVLAPRLIETWKTTGYPVADARCIEFIQKIPGNEKIFHPKIVMESADLDPAWEQSVTEEKTDTPILDTAAHWAKQISRGAYEIYLAFAVIGLATVLYRRQGRREYIALFLFAAVACVAICVNATAYRYFIFFVPLFMMFTVEGITMLFAFADLLHLKPVAMLGIGALALIQAENAFDPLEKTNGKQQQAMADFIRKNRKLFLPAGEENRKLVLATYNESMIVYWCDEARNLGYMEQSVSPTRMKNFDLFIMDRSKTDLATLMQARKDLEEVPHPFQKRYLLLKKISH